jgi:hypothetical protein
VGPSEMPSKPAVTAVPRRARRLLIWALCLGATVFLVADGIPGDAPSALAELASLLAVVVGSLLVTRVGGNPVSWLLWLAGLLLAVSLGTGGLASAGALRLGAVPAVAWLAWASALTGTAPLFIVAGLLPLVFPSGRLLSSRWRLVVALALGAGGIQLLAAALGVAATDTVGWLVLTALLGAVFVALIAGLQALLARVTGGDTLAVAASTLAAAALFQPLRGRVQTTVDARFNRSRYDAERIVAGLAGRLRDKVGLADIGRDVGTAVDRAVQPATVSVWLRGPAGSGASVAATDDRSPVRTVGR